MRPQVGGGLESHRFAGHHRPTAVRASLDHSCDGHRLSLHPLGQRIVHEASRAAEPSTQGAVAMVPGTEAPSRTVISVGTNMGTGGEAVLERPAEAVLQKVPPDRPREGARRSDSVVRDSAGVTHS